MDGWFLLALFVCVGTLFFVQPAITGYFAVPTIDENSSRSWNTLNTPYLANPNKLDGPTQELKYIEVRNDKIQPFKNTSYIFVIYETKIF